MRDLTMLKNDRKGRTIMKDEGIKRVTEIEEKIAGAGVVSYAEIKRESLRKR